tara:strand:+ start:1140 stop:1325 length:186 start_codon:yes stop_codon:yes gene_type:complete
MMMAYRSIKYILNKQVEMGSTKKWAWIEEDKEFVCVYHIIPDKSKQLYTPSQLLEKLKKTK